MPWQEAITAITSLSPDQIVLTLAIFSALMLVIEDRRLVLIPLVAQYVLLPVLATPALYRPIVWVRWGLGLAVGLLLLLTALHMEARRRSASLPQAPSTDSAPPQGPLGSWEEGLASTSMGTVFRAFSVVLSGLAAYGLRHAYPLEMVPAEVNLASYLLMIVGLVLMIAGVGPLRTGIGLLVLLNGFQALYAFLEYSLLVIGLLGVLDLLVALGVVVCTEFWLQSIRAQADATDGNPGTVLS
jgi:hypothetical protein